MDSKQLEGAALSAPKLSAGSNSRALRIAVIPSTTGRTRQGEMGGE
jgi:hypothetical protein